MIPDVLCERKVNVEIEEKCVQFDNKILASSLLKSVDHLLSDNAKQ